MSADVVVPASGRTFRMLAQIFVAFGQGAGQLPVSGEAVSAAVADYSQQIERSGGWQAAAPIVLGTARILGQAAAQHAIRARRVIITADDYQAARDAVHRMDTEAAELIGACPWIRTEQ